jgi:tetratricopeptide (TPR) repeat protein
MRLAVLALVVVALWPRDARAEELDQEALRLHSISRTAKSPVDRELAQFQLAVALHRMKFFTSSFAIFAEIADRPTHARFLETLPWLARLMSDLPEPADVVERVGKYPEATIDALRPDETRDRLHYMLGRYRERNHQYDDALRLFGKIDRSSPLTCKAQFLSGIVDVKLRRPAAAAQAFATVVHASDEIDGCDPEQRIRDLAILSIARTFYSSAVRIDRDGKTVADNQRLATALKYWNAVDQASEYWTDAVFEESWALYLLGDHSRALGNLHVLRSPFFTDVRPEADILRSTIHLSSCHYEDVLTLAARFDTDYRPVAVELRKLLGSFDGADDAFYKLLREVRDGRSNAAPHVKKVLEGALSDRQLLRHLQYVVMIDDEKKRFDRAPAAFKSSALGDDIRDVTQLVHDIAVRNAADLARERVRRTLAEIEDELRQNGRLYTTAKAGRDGTLDEESIPARVPSRQAERNVVKGDDEHVIWPFDGEYWPDEGGTYRGSIRSKCR